MSTGSEAEQRAGPPGQALIGSLTSGSPVIHSLAWIAPGAVVVGAVSIGPESSIWYGSVLRADADQIAIGARCNIQDLCCLHVDAGQPAELADRVSVGHHATVHGARIEAGALIGIGSVVLGGAVVGAGALIAAGAVVLPGTVVPAGVLFAGVPGKVVRDLTDADHERIRLTSQHYVERAKMHQAARWSESHRQG